MNITLAVDASFCPQTYIATYACHISGDKLDGKASRAKLRGTIEDSTTAELMGIVNGLYRVGQLQALYTINHIKVETDSLSSIQILSGSYKRSTEQKNSVIAAFNKFRKKFKGTIKLVHVKAHTTRRGRSYAVNRICDGLAGRLMRKERDKLLKEQTDMMLSPSEAVFGFASWLHSRNIALDFSKDASVGPTYDALTEYCKQQRLTEPDPDWHKKMLPAEASNEDKHGE